MKNNKIIKIITILSIVGLKATGIKLCHKPSTHVNTMRSISLNTGVVPEVNRNNNQVTDLAREVVSSAFQRVLTKQQAVAQAEEATRIANAATKIQSAYRASKARELLTNLKAEEATRISQEQALKNNAATKIQSAYRVHEAKKLLVNLKAEKTEKAFFNLIFDNIKDVAIFNFKELNFNKEQMVAAINSIINSSKELNSELQTIREILIKAFHATKPELRSRIETSKDKARYVVEWVRGIKLVAPEAVQDQATVGASSSSAPAAKKQVRVAPVVLSEGHTQKVQEIMNRAEGIGYEVSKDKLNKLPESELDVILAAGDNFRIKLARSILSLR